MSILAMPPNSRQNGMGQDAASLCEPANPPLYDVQAYQDTRGIALRQAGVKAVQMPVTIAGKPNQVQSVAASVSMSVGLDAEHKGTHMSRFVMQLAEWPTEQPLNLHVSTYLSDMKCRLSATTAYLDARFSYFIRRIAPVSDLAAPMAYDITLLASVDAHNCCKQQLTVRVPIATVCPCSKMISRYGAHNQRVMLTVTVSCNDVQQPVWIVPLISNLEECSSCPVYPLLKRQDEKYVTERGYENAKFVEDVAREVTLLLRQYPGVDGFKVEVEALESIHAHNAWACHEENFRSLLSSAITTA